MDWEQLKKSQQVNQLIRDFFKDRNFLEVSTPVLAPSLIPESYLEIFKTEVVSKLGKSQPAYLTPSPELWHKRLIAAGSGDIFEITKSFRNTDFGGHFHNVEFTLLEWYRVGVLPMR